jgi:NADPH-dependent 2,4-dienoyl-CoA reductase/sulfur reductase-like enzyme
MAMTKIHDVAVIGAGPAGLSAAYELKKICLDPMVLEKTAAVDDVWPNHYDGVRLNTGLGAKPYESSEEAALNVDAIVAGTGFRTGLTKLIWIPGITTADDRPVVQGDHEFRDAPQLYIIGHFVPLSGYFRKFAWTRAGSQQKSENNWRLVAPLREQTHINP